MAGFVIEEASLATLLCVDDDPARLEVLQARLTKMGYETVTARNGAGALELFSHKSFDLVIVDYYMLGMGGDTVALEMKRLRRDVPIIIFSGTFTLSEMVIALVDGFVFAGDGVDTLTNKILELLSRHQLGTNKEQDVTSLDAA
jgi:CheY-like chemotaxis protein